ncbi:MAG: redox-regulated ATPase YchF [Clostridiales bacterium]|jgi:GTP-binding protein YchF|nr:redox-regulated ATPase YchF [Clostridiales bacterium]MDY4655531.1 redox-regulated ATPase YchF [Eubacteriales bacterium]
MKLGVVGLPNVGKSTLFNALTKAGAPAANYPFCTIEPNVGIVTVKDERIDKLTALYNSKSTVYTTIEFVDIAGLVKGASKGEGLGNKFLSHIREVDAIVHVVRCFDDENITHVDGKIDPVRDIETINLELIFSDMDALSRRIDKTKTAMKSGDKKYKEELDILMRIDAALQQGKSVRSMEFTKEEKEFVDGLFLLSSKPVIYCANVSEGGEDNDYVKAVTEYAKNEGSEVVALCVKLEEELSELPDDEKEMFMEELGIKESGLDKLVKKCYSLLGLISFLTAGEKETRAWTIEKGTKAPQAAGKIHSDFEKGFIRAEVVDYDTLMECGSYNAAKEKGKVRSEGKDYVFKDGDVVLFRFNV